MSDGGLRILVRASADAAAHAAAAFIARATEAAPDLVLGLPTGRTMVPLYDALVKLHARGRMKLDAVTAFNLDEFAGLPARHTGSFESYMRAHFYDRVRMRGACHFPPVDGRDPASYDRLIADAGGLDLCVLGLGANGHIGFNEPGDALVPRTHKVRLQPATRRANAYLFDGDTRRVPTSAVSMGIATILRSRVVMLLVTGPSKATIVRRALLGPITTRVPASLLQVHPHAVVFLDRDSSAQLTTNN